MKNLVLTLFLLASLHLGAQTDGISYQAVIIGPDNQELPGVDAEGNILPNATIAIRFTILDNSNMELFQEVQTTNTDQYGRINLIIGSVNSVDFVGISWDGSPKDLKVEIDFSGGTNYVNMSREELTFLPYAFHRNITASGTLTVDHLTFLNGELQVQGPTNLNSTLNVNNGNATNLSGELNVNGNTVLKNKLDVFASTVLNDTLTVEGPTFLNDSLFAKKHAIFEDGATIKGKADFDSIQVKNYTNLKGITEIDSTMTITGQVTISPNIDNTGSYLNYNKYPLKVEGSSQGIAIKIDGSRSSANNFISFWDDTQMWGRIEGLSLGNLENSEVYLQDRKSKNHDIFWAGYDATYKFTLAFLATQSLFAAYTSSTACIGVGACVTVPIPSFILVAVVNNILKIANFLISIANLEIAVNEREEFDDYWESKIGVTYVSGSGDFAEWLPKKNSSDVFSPGELVGIKNGKVTKNTWGVEKIMIVSTRPIVLGNMPQPNEEKNSVKIAFMGQVPVKVLGKVNPGDYILPNELGIGFARAVTPKNMKTRDYKKIAGVAWNVIEEVTEGLRIVNVAVGINTNDLSEIVAQQEDQIKSLKEIFRQLNAQVTHSNAVLSNLLPGYADALGNTKDVEISEVEKIKEVHVQKNTQDQIVYHDENNIIYFEISREQIETGIAMAREQYLQMPDNNKLAKSLFVKNNEKSTNELDDMIFLPIEDHPFWQKIDNDPSYKDEIIQFIQSGLEKAYHTHKKYTHNFTDLKVKKD